MTNTSVILKTLDRRIRSSKAYTDWVYRNKGPMCLKCSSKENLECHHIILLYHIILGAWNFYGEPEEVFKQIVNGHEDNKYEGITLCSTCHKLLHPGRIFADSASQINTDTWCALPRNLKLEFNHSKKVKNPKYMSLLGYQTILGIGWNMMNGQVKDRILTINRRRFAELIGKTPGTSFNNGFENALHQVQANGVLTAFDISENQVELHLSHDYLNMLEKNPWFVPLSDIYANSLCVLTLRIFLGMQSCRKTYGIGLEKLKIHLGLAIKQKSRALESIQNAVNQIEWAKLEVKESLWFAFSSRRPSPIRSLRMILTDCIEQAR
jgi:hypothetical protein